MYKILSRVQIGSYQVGSIWFGFLDPDLSGLVPFDFIFLGKRILDSKNTYKFSVWFQIGYFCISSSSDFRVHIKMPTLTRYSVFNQQYGTSSEIIIFLLAFLLLIFFPFHFFFTRGHVFHFSF